MLVFLDYESGTVFDEVPRKDDFLWVAGISGNEVLSGDAFFKFDEERLFDETAFLVDGVFGRVDEIVDAAVHFLEVGIIQIFLRERLLEPYEHRDLGQRIEASVVDNVGESGGIGKGELLKFLGRESRTMVGYCGTEVGLVVFAAAFASLRAVWKKSDEDKRQE